MAKISQDQKRFLQAQSIPLSRVFDAAGMSKSSYRAAMKKLDMTVAVGVTPCQEYGHTLRTRSGHCAQCNTHALAFQQRHDETGEIYVAMSKQIGLVKLGTAQCSYERINSLNNEGYGGANDWRIYYHQIFKKSGRLEFLAQNRLDAHRTSKTYTKTGNSVNCQELFNCSPSVAKAAIQAAFSSMKIAGDRGE